LTHKELYDLRREQRDSYHNVATISLLCCYGPVLRILRTGTRGGPSNDRNTSVLFLSRMSALEVEAKPEVITLSEDGSKKEVAEQSKQDIANAVKALIETALESDGADDSHRQSFRSATDRLLETVKLGRGRGLSRLDIHSAITDAARGESTTEETRAALYDAIKSIGPGGD